jgi:O-antigen ligase
VQPALLITLIGTSYLLLAGVPGWTKAPIAAVAALAAAAAPRRTFSFPTQTRSLDITVVVLLGAILLQALPLPIGLLNVLSPNAVPLRDATRLAMVRPGWLPLSIDAGATLQAAGVVALGIVTYWIARGAFSAGGSTRRFCRIVGWMAGLFAVVAMVHRAVRPGLLMGIVATEARNANPMGPFTNRNHFATWMLLAATATIGYVIAHLQIHPAYRERARVAITHFLASGALLSGICAVIAIGALLITLSRSAAVGLGAAAMAGAWLGRERLRVERTNLPRLLAITGIAVLLLTAFVDVNGWLTRLQQSVEITDGEFSRIAIWRESLPILRDFPLSGTGAGTYGQAMASYQQSRYWVGAMRGWAFFNNAHSHYLQVACEGGLLLAVPAIAALVLLARLALSSVRADKGETFWVRIGAAAGLVGLAVQGIWEVPLVMPANAILAGALAGLLTYRRDRHHHDAHRRT